MEFSECGDILAKRDVGSNHTKGRRYGLKSRHEYFDTDDYGLSFDLDDFP